MENYKILCLLCLVELFINGCLLLIPFDGVSIFQLDMNSNNTHFLSSKSIDERVDDIIIINLTKFIFLQILLLVHVNFGLESNALLKSTLYWMAFLLVLMIISKFILMNLTLSVYRSAYTSVVTLFSFLEIFFAGYLVEPQEEEQAERAKLLSTRELLRFMKLYIIPKHWFNKIRSFMMFVFLGMSRVCAIISPLFIGVAVDELGKEDSDQRLVIRNIFFFIITRYFIRVFDQLQRTSYLRVTELAYTDVQAKSFAHIFSLSLNWHLQKKMGKVIRSLDRGAQAMTTIVRLLFRNLLPTVIELGAVAYIFYREFNLPQVSGLLILAFVVYLFVTYKVTRWRKRFRSERVRFSNLYHDKVTESLVNYEAVKSFTNEDKELNEFKDAVGTYQRYNSWIFMSFSILLLSQELIMCMTVLGALVFATIEVVQDKGLSVGDFVTIQVYLFNIFAPIHFLGNIYDTLLQAFVDVAILSELLATAPEIKDDPTAIIFDKNQVVDVCFDEVSFWYKENVNSGLRDVNFRVNPGETLAIIGHTGAGKSTIIKLLLRFYDPNEGRVLFCGEDIRSFTQKSIRQAIGIVPQDTILFNNTILMNLNYGKVDATQEEIELACQSAQILDFIESLPQGFETKVGERGLRLSGGEKQRIAIARCLLKNPPIVILDEATSALDTATESNIQASLDNLTQERTTIVIAHRLSTIYQSDQIIVLDHGKIIERGNHRELLRDRNSEYSRLWEAQAREENCD